MTKWTRCHRAGTVRAMSVLVSLMIVACESSAQRPVGGAGARRLGTIDAKGLNEISGLAASRRNAGVLWVHDDGGIEEIYAVDTSGAVIARVALNGEPEDCEDLALGPNRSGAGDFLYLGDIGDNDHDRDAVHVYRIAEPTFTKGPSKESPAAEIRRLTLVYPDGSHDAETLLVEPASGDLYIVTKEDGRARVYRAAAADWDRESGVELEHVLTLGIERVSAGDISSDGSWIALRREEVGWLWRLEEGQSVASALRGPAARIAVRGALQDENGEAIAFHPDGRGYFTISEGKRQPIYFFPLP